MSARDKPALVAPGSRPPHSSSQQRPKHRLEYKRHQPEQDASRSTEPMTWARVAQGAQHRDIRLETGETEKANNRGIQQPRQPFNQQGGYMPNGAPNAHPGIQAAPGATPLLPNQGRILQTGPLRVLCIADVRGRTIAITKPERERKDGMILTPDARKLAIPERSREAGACRPHHSHW